MPHQTPTNYLLFFPGALGDFLCFLPTAQALRRNSRAQVTIVAQSSFAQLLDPADFTVWSIDDRRTSRLYDPGSMHGPTFDLRDFDSVLSWTGSRDPHFRRHLDELAPGRNAVFPFREENARRHAREYFAACAGITRLEGVHLSISPEARNWARQQLADGEPSGTTLLLHAGSGSQRKNWLGHSDVASAWQQHSGGSPVKPACGGKVIALYGPADVDQSDTASGFAADLAICDQPLDRVAALLASVDLYLGNDSGISHLAAAAGCRGIAVFADTDPLVWHPGGDIEVLQAADRCSTCPPQTFCTHRLDPQTVLRELERVVVKHS